MMLLIQNGHVLDPLTGFDQICDVLVCEGRIEKIETSIQAAADKVLDASGCYVMPGFIDLHVHLRDPGLTHKETLKSGGDAAVRGGITTMCAMPNTKPIIDSKELVQEVHRRAPLETPVHIVQLGAITKGQLGGELSDIQGMAGAGCRAISEDGRSVMDPSLYRKAMYMAKDNGLSVFAHCEDRSLMEGGVMNAGSKAGELGLKGITNSVEDVIVARDILLAKETGVRLHLCHCSTADSVKMIEIAKKEKLSVTGEVCPHHFILSDEDIRENHGRYKMNPPLRSVGDVEALREGLKSGVMDVIATDHAPHTEKEKDLPIDQAAFGIVGLETCACLTYTELVHEGVLTPMQMAEKMSYNPAKILGLSDKGSISQGKRADIVIFDPRPQYKIDKNMFRSKGRNTPFHGYEVKGRVRWTIIDGDVAGGFYD